ncbi:hypothetical protein NQ314_002325 [Rhamnusium bicolor]|uniref:RRM domain-containing protein n=1 Tax=Rhamnusium bicolor TaxID=1586634 RepID=A0AAV8ZRS8_9CUCU|nr:hypothetical protein NQ314_002325 [Rhamnusium bicolor]
MSRLIVKNLPKNITEEKLQHLFGEKGTVTDIQLKYTPEGKFRRFGFVGYQNETEAEEAIKSLNLTFINTSKITVENCALLGDEKKPKAWSKYAPDSTAYKKANKIENTIKVPSEKKPKKKTEKIDEAAQLLEKEFLQVHAPKEVEKLHSMGHKILQNEDGAINSNQSSESVTNSDNNEDDNVQDELNKIANEQISDMEYMRKLMKTSGDSMERKPRQKMEKKVKEKIKLLTIKLRDLPYNAKKRDIKQFFKPITPYSIRIPRNIHGIAFVGFKTEKLFNKALMKDRSFIKGKRVSVIKYVNNSTEMDDNDKNPNPLKNKWKNQEEALKNEEDIAESGKIFIRNLAYTTTEEDIENLFSKYEFKAFISHLGPLTEVNLPVDTSTRKMKGFGTITFLMPEHAVKAYSELDGSVLHGRMVHLLPGKSKDMSAEDNLEESTNYKQKKAAKEKAQAGLSHNWNSLFLGHDAVAEVIADTYGTTKEAVVGPEGKGSAAVRLALGETQIVAQTRKYLEQEGVILDAFKNIFEKHGEIGRVVLPPSGITAIVEFLEPSEARKAFTRLAYSKFKNAPLYLEWAPENSLGERQVKEKLEVDKKSVEHVDEEANKNIIQDIEAEEPEPDTTLFVKNLNFKTSDDALRKIQYANVATKKDKNDPKNVLSMGYGFVRYMHKVSADKALKTLQQSVLDGKSLELKRSERTLKNEVQSARKTVNKTKQTGTKILVRNVPFQAKQKEIRELFSTFGEIKALRLPKKMAIGADSHRGFAFVDYATTSDAKAAFEALSQSTHLYGRRLVLEWAASEEGVDEIRKRTADHFKSTEEVKSKKSVFSIE